MTSTAESTCAQLLQQARGQDRSALGLLLERYRPYLNVLARVQIGRQLQGKVDPGDVVQEALLGAFRDFSHFRGTTEDQFRCWLREILGSLLANWSGITWEHSGVMC